MAKTNYQVTFNGEVVGIRKSDRIYTHAVVVHDDADAFYHWAHNYVPNETDRKNFAYDSKRAVQIVEQYLAEWKYQKPDYVESQISEAKAKVEGGFEAYAERLRQEKIQMYEDRLAKGGFLPYVAGWCGRPDLAQKASTKRDFVGPRYWGRTNFLAIVPIEIAPAKEDVSEEVPAGTNIFIPGGRAVPGGLLRPPKDPRKRSEVADRHCLGIATTNHQRGTPQIPQ
jgi:hypothetical protein